MNPTNRISGHAALYTGALLLVVAAFSLGGCFQTVSQPGQGEIFMSPEQLSAKDDAICKGYGAQPGTSAYINCRGQQDQRRTTWRTSD